MAANIDEIRNKVVGSDGITGRLQDAVGRLGNAPGGPVDLAINSAREDYEKIRPRPRVVKLAGTGGFDFAINTTNFPGYVDLGDSRITEVVYPYLETQPWQPPLDRRLWAVVRIDTGLMLRLYGFAAVGQFVLARYTAPHTLDASTSTIPATDDEAIADLAAAYASDTLANYYTQSTDASIGADVDNRLSKAAEYRADAEKWRTKWRRKMGLIQDELPPRPGISTRPLRRA